MVILILEGIATSGKSTVAELLVNSLSPKLDVKALGEDQTHVPIMDKKDGLHIDFFEKLLTEAISTNPDVLIVDRLYMTQAFRAKQDLTDYAPLEKLLLRYKPVTIFLRIDERQIAERIDQSTEHRNPEWREYISEKSQEKVVAQYYVDQQRSQLKLLEQSLVPYKIIDTTDSNYKNAAKEVVDLALLQ